MTKIRHAKAVARCHPHTLSYGQASLLNPHRYQWKISHLAAYPTHLAQASLMWTFPALTFCCGATALGQLGNFVCVNLSKFSLSQICITESIAENLGEGLSFFSLTFSSTAFYYNGSGEWGGQSLV